MLIAAALVLLAGAAIGATSIGGVLVVPALAGVAGLPVGEAIAASSFGFVLTGLLGWRERSSGQTGTFAKLWPLHAAALAGAAGGALLVHIVSPGAVRLWVALIALGSGLYALAASRSADLTPRPCPRGATLAAIGAAVGCGSALSGTGGPVLLLPVFLLLGVPTAIAVATAQAIQLPIALASSATHFAAGRLDVAMGLIVGVALIAGAWAGLRLARGASTLVLRRCTAIGLIATGLCFALT
jgi:uncharacterized membrane protein YfcA